MISLQFDKAQPLKGYRLVSLRAEDRDAPLAICLFVRADEPGSSPFILLRETIDSSIFLGCIVDRAGHPKASVEIWVQNVDRVALSFRARLEQLTNALLAPSLRLELNSVILRPHWLTTRKGRWSIRLSR
jgi:hypothetical protein